MITQDVCRRETCQRICSIHFSRYLHNFDVFRLDGLLNPQVLGLEMFQTSRAMPEQHGLACGSVQCVNQRTSPHLTSHFTQNVHQSQHAGQGPSSVIWSFVSSGGTCLHALYDHHGVQLTLHSLCASVKWESAEFCFPEDDRHITALIKPSVSDLSSDVCSCRPRSP